jgi:hypothetical protein
MSIIGEHVDCRGIIVVAIITLTISFNRVVNILDCTPDVASESPPSRFAARASNSSKKSMQGDAALARANIDRRRASEPPSH